ncbi:DciA family protein [Halomonas sp. Bachu 37]|uniref:DUF721 domain-containing protein n=1 Tax=Halomonas kashgarensis TaxID=3084920 RepID=UPI003217F6F0
MSIKVKRSRAQPISRLLDNSSELGQLMRISHMLEQAQRHLRLHLPEEMREHVFVGGYRQGRLTVITNRAIWLTWLRFEQTRLLELLHQLHGFESVIGLSFKVRPVRPPKLPVRYTRELPDEAGELLSRCAEDVDDPKLKDALQRLAGHAKRAVPEQ